MNSMQTPINKLPQNPSKINTKEDNDIQDPMVQDVLKDFEEEVEMAKRPLNENYQPQYALPPQAHQPYPLLPTPQPQYYNNKSYIDIDLIKKSLILSLIVFLIFFPTILEGLLQKLPENIKNILISNLFIFRIFLIFISYYLLFYFYDTI